YVDHRLLDQLVDRVRVPAGGEELPQRGVQPAAELSPGSSIPFARQGDESIARHELHTTTSGSGLATGPRNRSQLFSLLAILRAVSRSDDDEPAEWDLPQRWFELAMDVGFASMHRRTEDPTFPLHKIGRFDAIRLRGK